MDNFLYENHRGSPTLTLLNVLNVLNVLNLLNMPNDPSLTNTEKIEMFLEGDFIFTGFAAVINTVDWMLNGTVGTAFGGRAKNSV